MNTQKSTNSPTQDPSVQSFINDQESFLQSEQNARDCIAVRRSYVDVCDDLVAGVLLGQIVYWFLPSKEKGASRLRVRKNGILWLAKRREDWWKECRITGKQFDRAIKVLERLQLVSCKVFKFDNSPTKHITLNCDLLRRIHAHKEITPEVMSILPFGEYRNLPLGNLEITERGRTLTETTSETTSEKNTPLAPQGGRESIDDSCQPENQEDPYRASEEQNSDALAKKEVLEVNKPPAPPRRPEPKDPFRIRAEEIFSHYPKKVGKDRAIRAITKRIKEGLDKDWLIERVKKYAECMEGGERQFIPYPSTWFNDGRFEDDEAEWVPKIPKPPEKKPGSSNKWGIPTAEDWD